MRVLHVIGSSKYGGAYAVIFSLCKMAQNHGIKPYVLTTDSHAKRRCLDLGVSIVDFKGVDRAIRPWTDLLATMRLTQYLKKNSFDIVHTHTLKGGFVGRLAARRAQVPVVFYHAHAFLMGAYGTILVDKMIASLERMAADWCDLVVTTTSKEKEEALRFNICEADKIVALNNGISDLNCEEIAGVSEKIRSEFGASNSDIICVVVGRVEHAKGHDVLIDALASLLRRKPSLPLRTWIVGEGEALEKCRVRTRSLGLEGRVIFSGFRDDVPCLLRAADLFCIPSWREGLSIAVLEAMRAGLPCIVSDIRGNREIFEDNTGSALFSVGDHESLANLLARVSESADLRAKMGSSARSLYLERFTEKAFVERAWNQVYRVVLKRKGMV